MGDVDAGIGELGRQLFGQEMAQRNERLRGEAVTKEELTPEMMAALPDPVIPPIAEWFGLNESYTADLLDEIATFIRRYVYLRDDQEAILAVWILHTYVFRLSFCTPYMFVTAAEKACGKSLLMDVLRALANNPRRSGGMTAAALVRVIDQKRPTLFLDEMDSQLASDKEFAAAVQGVLNEGYRRDGVFTKCDGKNNDVRDFAVYCPKCFAGIGNLLHDTTASRSVRIEMQRKTASEHVTMYSEEGVTMEAALIRKRIAEWAKTVKPALRWIRYGCEAEWDGRTNDTARPLLTIALLDMKWANRLRSALRIAFKISAEATESFGTMLLSDIRDYFTESRAVRATTTELLDYLTQLDERPWVAWGFRHEPMKPHQLAKELRRYHIGSRNLRVSGAVVKGYPRSDFEDAWQRFCLPEPKDDVQPVAKQNDDDGLTVI
ncbi:MAG TPA: DUF3631 domain-containing protein [Terracidiphilus sp.]|nr:DUF3631 domain-containing protein [Terracidiphilus sp.]